MTDYVPMRAYDALIKWYSAEKSGADSKILDLSSLEKSLNQKDFDASLK